MNLKANLVVEFHHKIQPFLEATTYAIGDFFISSFQLSSFYQFTKLLLQNSNVIIFEDETAWYMSIKVIKFEDQIPYTTNLNIWMRVCGQSAANPFLLYVVDRRYKIAVFVLTDCKIWNQFGLCKFVIKGKILKDLWLNTYHIIF